MPSSIGAPDTQALPEPADRRGFLREGKAGRPVGQSQNPPGTHRGATTDGWVRARDSTRICSTTVPSSHLSCSGRCRRSPRLRLGTDCWRNAGRIARRPGSRDRATRGGCPWSADEPGRICACYATRLRRVWTKCDQVHHARRTGRLGSSALVGGSRTGPTRAPTCGLPDDRACYHLGAQADRS